MEVVKVVREVKIPLCRKTIFRVSIDNILGCRVIDGIPYLIMVIRKNAPVQEVMVYLSKDSINVRYGMSEFNKIFEPHLGEVIKGEIKQ